MTTNAELAEAVKACYAESDGITVWMTGELAQALYAHLTAQPAAPAVVGGPSPLYFNTAIDLLNKVKAWRDCDGNDGFPHDVREHIDALLMAVEVRTTGTFAQQVARNLPTPPEGPQP